MSVNIIKTAILCQDVSIVLKLLELLPFSEFNVIIISIFGENNLQIPTNQQIFVGRSCNFAVRGKDKQLTIFGSRNSRKFLINMTPSNLVPKCKG